MRWSVFRVIVAVACLLVVAACGAPPVATDTQTPPISLDERPTSMPFNVEIDGLTIEGHCTGERTAGLPVVVLQSGNGAGDTHLSGIEAHLVDRAQVCAFARPGAEGSEAPTNGPRSVGDVVAEVHDVLATANIEPPYFLVGQSAGAAITFLFAQAYPDEVAGFVFMNGNPPFETWVNEAPELGIPQDAVDAAVSDFSGNNPERIDFRSNESMLSDPLPATMPYAVMYDECGDGPDCVVAGESVIFEQLAAVGQGGSFIWAKGAGHEIHLSDPQLVYDTIDEVWAEAIH